MFFRRRDTTEAGGPARSRFNPFNRSEIRDAVPFCHEELDTSIDGIRLLRLKAASDPLAPVVGLLEHVTFAQRPKYEALSYTWGDEITKVAISIDGKLFMVGQNLYDALRFIRHRSEDRVLWIDAICINQANVPERNSQIRMMPFTYSRASQVLIWLNTTAWEPQSLREIFSTSSADLSLSTIRILLSLCRNPYWWRVWIIQEIGLSRRIQIHCGIYNMPWSRFISKIEACKECHDSPPLKFQKQLDERYSGGHELQTLIETHSSSLCKEPRDHIYGLIGLAMDCEDKFPIDYNKSLYEVWKDTVMFKARSQGSQDDILRFARTVKTLLGGRIVNRHDLQIEHVKHMSALEELWDDEYNLVQSIRHGETLTLRVPTRIAGRISHLGPTYQEIISDTRKILEWKSSIAQFIQPDQLSSAREENDVFMEVLENTSLQDMTAISGYTDMIAWEAVEVADTFSVLEAPREYDSIDAHERSMITEPRLFLLSGTKENDPSCSGKMGLVPPEAEIGDYICRIQGIAKALVVRKRTGFRAIGTAVVAENRFLAQSRREDGGDALRFRTAQFHDIPSDERLDAFIDIATAYELLN